MDKKTDQRDLVSRDIDAEAKRRQIVKNLTLGGGAIAVTQWTRPMVDTVVVPAHASTSPSMTLVGGNNVGTVQVPAGILQVISVDG